MFNERYSEHNIQMKSFVVRNFLYGTISIVIILKLFINNRWSISPIITIYKTKKYGKSN